MAEYVLDLAVLVDIIGAEPIRLVGHSLGGLVSLEYMHESGAAQVRRLGFSYVGIGRR